MSKYRCYLRTIFLSAFCALIIDALVNFEEYREGWVASFSKDTLQNSHAPALPFEIGKVTGAVCYLLMR
jgi:hypothetical protein